MTNIIKTVSLIGAFVFVTLLPTARAVTPPPDGGYPGYNTAEGENALLFVDTSQGIANTAVGYQTLLNLTIGVGNTAIGWDGLFNSTIGSLDTAVGNGALEGNTTGSYNTATGAYALGLNTTGNSNTSIGLNALQRNTTGNFNTAVGVNAGSSLTTGSNDIDIGNVGLAAESRVIRIGTKITQRNTFIAGISGVTVAAGVGVIIDTNGHLGTVVSSKRFKDAIKPMDKASEAILALQPVTFHYKHELDPDGIPQFGLVAEQVEKVNPDLVARDEQGKAYTVRYEAVNAMLLNEFLKEHRQVQDLKSVVAKQEAIAAEQQKEIQTLTANAKEQASQIKKVSAQVEMNKPAPQVVDNQ